MKNILILIISLFSIFLQAQEIEIIVQEGDTTFRVKLTNEKRNGEVVTRLLPEQDSIGAANTVASFLNSLYDDEARSYYSFEENRQNANQVAQLYRNFTGVNIAQSGNEELEAGFQGRWRLREGNNNDLIEVNQNGAFNLNGNIGQIRVFSALKISINNYYAEIVILYSKDGNVFNGNDSSGNVIRLIRK